MPVLFRSPIFKTSEKCYLNVEDAYENAIADEWGPANAVTPFQIRSMFRMAKLKGSDVYYDLGSGHGRTVRFAVTEFHTKRAVGIEQNPERFCHARALAKKQLKKANLAKVDFWLEEMDDLKDSDLVGATVAYYGLDPSDDEARTFRRLFGKRRVRIIKKDLPIIGYAPVACSRESRTTWFFLMSYPLTNHRIMDKNEWAKTILGPEATMDDVFKYFDRQLKRRDILDRAESVNELKNLINLAFKK